MSDCPAHGSVPGLRPLDIVLDGYLLDSRSHNLWPPMEDFPAICWEFEAASRLRRPAESICFDSVARRFTLPAVPRADELAEVRCLSGVLGLWTRWFGDGRGDLPGYPQALDPVVPSGLPGNQPAERPCSGLQRVLGQEAGLADSRTSASDIIHTDSGMGRMGHEPLERNGYRYEVTFVRGPTSLARPAFVM